jgi:prevent-host-death family protein
VETIGVRELQQNASATLRRVEQGESVGVTDRGRLVAVLVPPSVAAGSAGLMAAGRVQPARRSVSALGPPVPNAQRSGDVLDALRAEG